MKVIRISAVLLILVLQFTPVMAQTTTPTNEVLWPTSTPEPPVDYTCPTGVPAGYGTVTPNPEWLLQCGSCIGGGSTIPTVDWGMPTIPSMVTTTPTPYLTATPYPTVQVGQFNKWRVNNCNNCGLSPMPYYWIWSNWLPISVEPYHTADQITFTTIQYSTTQQLNDPNDVDAWLSIDCDATWTNGIPVQPSHVILVTTFGGAVLGTMTYSCGAQGVSGGCSNSTGMLHYSASAIRNGYVQVESKVLYNGYKIPQSNYCHIEMNVIEQEPQPTPEPTPDSYCNNINSGMTNSDLDPFSILPQPTIGQATCYGIPGFYFEGIGETIPEFTFPGLGVCFRAIEFGSMNLLGMGINLDWIASIMAGIAVIRIFLRS